MSAVPVLAVDPDALPDHLQVLEEAILVEQAAWKALLDPRDPQDVCPQSPRAFPAPGATHGLPRGWTVVAVLAGYQADTDLYLVRRTAGGWMLLRHESDLERTQMFWLDESLGHLYQHLCEELATRSPASTRLTPIADWLHQVLMSMYDQDDEVEAGEQLLFALGANLTYLPLRAR